MCPYTESFLTDIKILSEDKIWVKILWTNRTQSTHTQTPVWEFTIGAGLQDPALPTASLTSFCKAETPRSDWCTSHRPQKPNDMVVQTQKTKHLNLSFSHLNPNALEGDCSHRRYSSLIRVLIQVFISSRSNLKVPIYKYCFTCYLISAKSTHKINHGHRCSKKQNAALHKYFHCNDNYF